METSLSEIVTTVLSRLRLQFPDSNYSYRILTIKNNIASVFLEPDGIDSNDYDYIDVCFYRNFVETRVILKKGRPITSLYDMNSVRIDLYKSNYNWFLRVLFKERESFKIKLSFDTSFLTKAWNEALAYAEKLSMLSIDLPTMEHIIKERTKRDSIDVLGLTIDNDGEIRIDYNVTSYAIFTKSNEGKYEIVRCDS